VVLGGYFATLAGMRKPYPTDLSDAEWSYIEPPLPAPKGHGRPRTHSLREILNAVFYLLKRAVVSGAYFPTTSRVGPPSSTILGNGVSTVPGRGSTGLSENGCGCA